MNYKITPDTRFGEDIDLCQHRLNQHSFNDADAVDLKNTQEEFD